MVHTVSAQARAKAGCIATSEAVTRHAVGWYNDLGERTNWCRCNGIPELHKDGPVPCVGMQWAERPQRNLQLAALLQQCSPLKVALWHGRRGHCTWTCTDEASNLLYMLTGWDYRAQ